MGKYNIKQVLNFTYQSKQFKNRIKNRNRDVLKSIRIQELKDLASGKKRWRVITSSYPQYKPYTKIKGKYSKKQRKIKHKYDITLLMTALSINTTEWKIRVGSQKKWIKNPPQTKIKQIYQSTSKKIKEQSESRFDKKKDRAKFIKQEKDKIRKRGKYLDVGDYNARVKGINGDFLFRLEYILRENDHLYGRNRATTPPEITNKKEIQFFDKHSLRLIEILMNKGILKDI